MFGTVPVISSSSAAQTISSSSSHLTQNQNVINRTGAASFTPFSYNQQLRSASAGVGQLHIHQDSVMATPAPGSASKQLFNSSPGFNITSNTTRASHNNDNSHNNSQGTITQALILRN